MVRSAVRVILIVVVAAGWTVAGGGSAGAQAPDTTAWWSAANTGAVTAPAPPDVAGDDLLVQGASASTSIVDTAPPYQALAGLSYSLVPGATVGSLVLGLKEPAPTAAVKACRALGPVQRARNGVWTDVPRYDCSKGVTAAVNADGTTLTFAGIGALAGNDTLAVVLVPTTPTRVVVAAPTSTSLTVSAGSTVESSPAATGDAATPDSGGSAVAAVPGPLAAGLLAMFPVPSAAAGTAPSVAPPPVAAVPSTPGPATAALRARPVRFAGDSTKGKLIAALVVFAALSPFALRGARRTAGR